jgi:hypothetical protein
VTPAAFTPVAARTPRRGRRAGMLVVATSLLWSGGATALFAAAAMRYPDGPPAAVTGGFGEDTCHACHFMAEPNDAAGTLKILGVPARYVPGRSYDLEILLERTGMKVGGFQLAARLETGAQAGRLDIAAVDTARAGILVEGGVRYAQHRHGGITAAAGAIAWSVVWTAPEAGAGPVYFHLAANAGDGDDTISGDYVYTISAGSRPPR